MTIKQEIFYLTPSEVLVQERQRSELDKEKLEELKLSIEKWGQFTPILVRKEQEKVILVYGQHRLEACKGLNISVAAFFFENLTPLEAKIIELEENIKRSDLDWKDKTKAIAEIHELHKKEDEKWTLSQTASELSLSVSYISQVMTVKPYLSSKKLEAATSLTHAYHILNRFADRKASEIVSTLIGAGSGLFTESKKATDVGTKDGGATSRPTISTGGSRPPTLFEGDKQTTQENSVQAESPIQVSSIEDLTSVEVADVEKPVLKEEKVEVGPILNTNFIEWAASYSSEKFSLIHTDFPYGVFHSANKEGKFGSTFDGTTNTQDDLYDNNPKIYWDLLDAFIKNFNNFASNSCHVIFWFSFNFYTETKTKLEKTGLKVQAHPFIWHKTDSKGVSPWPYGPKRIYDAAFICSRGERSMVKQGTNCFGAPTTASKIHPSEKSLPMLEYFLSSYIDETTAVLDICSGSGVAIRAAENLNARKTLGIELNPEYAKAGNDSILKARNIKRFKL